jgi:hypothetical protein
MATCRECLYYDVCPLGLAIKGSTGTCLKFKNKADFVEVVRCGDCKHFCFDNGGMCQGKNGLIIAYKDQYCSYGERSDT